MKEISIFLANYYLWFVAVDVFILFGLIGYLMENKKKKKISSETEVLETIKLDDNKDDLTIKLGDNANKSLNSVVSNINTNELNQEETETLM